MSPILAKKCDVGGQREWFSRSHTRLGDKILMTEVDLGQQSKSGMSYMQVLSSML
jgi:hypothetical protein